uniref:Uncharacterized protein n=1 Tax=Arundo donax TaxID=35708 RepID=A0A0A9HD57_ARUDO
MISDRWFREESLRFPWRERDRRLRQSSATTPAAPWSDAA